MHKVDYEVDRELLGCLERLLLNYAGDITLTLGVLLYEYKDKHIKWDKIEKLVEQFYDSKD